MLLQQNWVFPHWAWQSLGKSLLLFGFLMLQTADLEARRGHQFVWKTGHWGRCVGDCGSGGVRSRAVWCTHAEGWTTYHANCDQKDKPESQRRCFKVCDWHLELFEWEVSGWDRCGLVPSVGAEAAAGACVTAQHGLQRRSVRCLQKLNGTVVANEICEYFTPQPPAEQACLVPCPRDCVVSEFSSWSQCGAGCTKSLQHRTRAVIAPPLYGGAPCPNLTESRACGTAPCPLGEEEHTYSLRVGAWGECRLPHPKDVDLAGRTMPDLGSDSGEPSTSGLQGHKPHQHPGEVEIGYQTRQVRCVRSDGKNAALSLCLQDPVPLTFRSCVVAKDCETTEWSSWSSCSRTCGWGHLSPGFRSRRRGVRSVALGAGKPCPELEEREACGAGGKELLQPCPRFAWRTSEWKACQVSLLRDQQDPRHHTHVGLCGGGVQTREVYCAQITVEFGTHRLKEGESKNNIVTTSEQTDGFWTLEPPLVQAIFSGDPEEIRMLIYKTEDVNALDAEKRTPLHVASFLGDADIIELLILSGARVNAKDNMWLTPLHRAVASRSEEAVQVLIKHSADVNARDKNWQTPLHVAAANKAVKCAEVIIPMLSSVNVSDRGGRTALHHAALNGHIEMVNLLLAKGANINAFDKKDRRALHWAAYMGHLEVVALLINHGAEVTCKDKKGYTPLHAAASNGQINVVKHLLNLGVEIDDMNIYGNTALHIACYNGQDSVVNELIDYGANVNQPNNNGFTPLHFAAASTHGALCLELLVNNGADVNVQSKDGKSPLHMTAVHGRFTRSQTLIQNGGEIDCVDKDGNTPLHVAARYGHELLINTLITSGADTAKCGIHNMFPLHLAALNAHSDCCRKLLSSGQKYSIVSLFSNEHVLSAGFAIDTPDSFGRTCLHAAAAGGNVECIKLLQSSGADFNKKDKRGRTPLHYAAANCHFHCIETLVTTGANVNETDDWGRTPLHYAAASDMDRKCLEFLLQNEANPAIQDKEGYNTVHYAAAYGHRQCLELLLEKNNNIFEESDSAAMKSPLHLAAYNGHHQALEVLLQSLVDLDIKDEKGRTALDLAAFKGHAECVEALISQGASVTVKDNISKRTPLHASVINGHTPCLRLLLEVADNPDMTDAKGQTPLMLAVAYGHVDAVSLLLEKEASVDAADLLGCTALHRGIMTGHEECVQMLLEKEVSILCKDARGRTPLHFAAARGHATWLSELLQVALSEEDCGLKDNQGYTPLHWASYNGHENCIEVLLEQKLFRTFYGNSFSPLHCAVINDHENCASLLIGAIDASIVNCKDDKGRTPLHAAAFGDHVECLQLLLSHSAQVNAADQAGRTPLMMAAHGGHLGAVDFLVNIAKADLTLKDKELNTCLHLASSKGHEKCALLILDKIEEQSLINAKNNALQTPLHIAARNGLKMVVEELLAKGACVLAVDENGHTPALACAPNKDVADCLALILATMMPFSPSSSMTAFNFVCFKKDNLGRTHLCDGSSLGSINSYNKPLSNQVGTEDGYNENDSDSETF